MQYKWGEAEAVEPGQPLSNMNIKPYHEHIIKYTLTWKDLTPEAQKAIRAFFKECEDARAEGFSEDDFVVNLFGIKEDEND